MLLARIFIEGMVGEENSGREGCVTEAKEETMSMKYMWSGCHGEVKDNEEGRHI